MKTYPILFNDDAVRAILDRRKTQTRRPVRFPSWLADAGEQPTCIPVQYDGYLDTREITSVDVRAYCKCPFGGRGDQLWVRECWQSARNGDTGEIVACYRTDWAGHGNPVGPGGKWRSSRHMPRWASRITLLVERVRVERVQDITNEAAIAEGCKGRERFFKVWDSLYAGDGFGVDANPWVRAGTFSVLAVEQTNQLGITRTEAVS